VGNLFIGLAGPLNPLFSVGKDLIRILSARIIRSQNHHITERAGSFAHRRAFRSVAITAATKYRDDLSFGNFAGGPQNVKQRVVAMRVINYHRKVSIMRDTFETSR